MLLERQAIYDGRVIQVSLDTVELPNGHRLPLEIVRHPGGAAVVALDAHDRICVLRQFRHAAVVPSCRPESSSPMNHPT
jgi:ADP-ribose pyrophosphatase